MKTILIANRGEIAIRIAETAKKMGIRVYMFLSHQEPNAHYLNFADEIIDVSSNTFINIFMDVEKIVAYAVENKIDAIHPGYGFLSENAFLAKECKNKGVTFIGPSNKLIEQMGNKGEARKMAKQAKVPVLEGSKGIISTLNEAGEVADSIGYPVIIKAVAGGGGKGMRVVENKDELPKMFKAAMSEALNIFGNGAVFIEKYVSRPRHIEVQVIGDQKGNVIHLYERECSIQRKHQKLMEEAPSPALNPELREKICEYAIQLCKETGYYSAGTVEFLLDENANPYFMEMNTRIQVEHPITEAITGVDIVEQQIRVANNETLAFKQEDIKIKGSAIEFRINAEDVQADFAPSTGIIEELKIPSHDNLRTDSGYVSGKVVPACFDSLVAKTIVHADTRDEAIHAANKILGEIKIKGIKTTIPFFRKVLTTDSFLTGTYYTDFIQNELDQLHFQQEDEITAAACIALSAYLEELKNIDEAKTKEKNTNVWFMKHILKSN